MKSIRKDKRRKPAQYRTAAVAAAVLGLSAVTAGLVLSGGGGPGHGTAVATSIAALAPADADTLVLAPYSKSWWAKVASMAPAETGIAGLDLSAFSGDINAIGYSRGQDHEKHDVPMTGPSRLFYVETTSPDAAGKLAAWLRGADGAEGRRVFVDGNTVVIGQSWLTSFKAPEQTLAAAVGYSGTLTTTEGSMYRSPDKEVQSLAGSADTASGKALSTVMRSSFGFTEGTTWIGTSSDGNTWAGDFRTGGVDPQQINFGQTQAALDATAKKITEVTNNNIKYTGYSSGMDALLTSSTFHAPGKGTMGSGQSAGSAPAVKDEAVSAVSDVTAWDAAATGIYSAKENVATQAVSASEHSMQMTFTYGAIPQATK